MLNIGHYICYIIILIYNFIVGGGITTVGGANPKYYLWINEYGKPTLNFIEFNKIRNQEKAKVVKIQLKQDTPVIESKDITAGYKIVYSNNVLYTLEKETYNYRCWKSPHTIFIKYWKNICQPYYQIISHQVRKSAVDNKLKKTLNEYINKYQFTYVQIFNPRIYLDSRQWYVAIKHDGIPSVIFSYEGILYKKIKDYIEPIGTCRYPLVVVCEHVSPTETYIVDALVWRNQDIASKTLDERQLIFPHIADSLGAGYKAQEFYKVEFNPSFWDQMNTKRSSKKNDGFIIQSPHPYYETIIMKWKEFLISSVDLYHSSSGDLMYNAKGICKSIKYISKDTLPGDEIVELVPLERSDDSIVFKLLKDRTDKDQPNSASVYRDSLDIMDDKISLSQLKGDSIHFMKHLMRKRSDWLYRKFIRPKSSILEIGSGNGRSARMWHAQELSVWCVEPNVDSFNEVRTRKEVESALNVGGEDNAIRAWIPQHGMDAICMIHSLTFFFESPTKLQKLFDNIIWTLKPGGLFICTTVDGYRLHETDNEAFKLILKKPNKAIITMKHSRTLVQDQEEYLVDLSLLKNTAQKNGFSIKFEEHYSNDNRLGKYTNMYYTAGVSIVFKLKN